MNALDVLLYGPSIYDFTLARGSINLDLTVNIMNNISEGTIKSHSGPFAIRNYVTYRNLVIFQMGKPYTEGAKVLVTLGIYNLESRKFSGFYPNQIWGDRHIKSLQISDYSHDLYGELPPVSVASFAKFLSIHSKIGGILDKDVVKFKLIDKLPNS